jgi:hypothetical protein
MQAIPSCKQMSRLFQPEPLQTPLQSLLQTPLQTLLQTPLH